MTLPNIPPHVPAQLVRDFDYFNMMGESDVHLWFKKLHDGPEIFYTPHHGGHWVVSRFDDIAHILENDREFSSRQAAIPKNPVVTPLFEHDGEIHNDFRKLVAPFFSPKSIGNLEGKARDLTVSLIEGFYAKGECEFTADFAQKMPILILMNLMGLPDEDIPHLLGIADVLARGHSVEERQAGWMRMHAYVAEKLEQRKRNPGSDMLSAIIVGRVEGGRPLNEQELIGLAIFLIGAGLDTVASMLGFVALFLARNPEHRRKLVADPGLINNALEEIMRRFHIANIARVVASDMTYKGVSLKAGDVIFAPTSAAGVDERRYADPLAVDFHRQDKRHLVFGKGPHQCMGAFLARTELRVFLTEWLQRIPDFDIKPGEQPLTSIGIVSAIRYLPLVWTVR